jgi:hypothetical protein
MKGKRMASFIKASEVKPGDVIANVPAGNSTKMTVQGEVVLSPDRKTVALTTTFTTATGQPSTTLNFVDADLFVYLIDRLDSDDENLNEPASSDADAFIREHAGKVAAIRAEPGRVPNTFE